MSIAPTSFPTTNERVSWPLLPLQQAMLYVHHLDPARDPYRMVLILGVASQTALSRTLRGIEKLALRHAGLRAYIAPDGQSEPHIRIQTEYTVPIDEVVLLPGADPCEQLRAQLLQTPCRLEERPSLRVLYAAGSSSAMPWLVAIHVHHIFVDQVSLLMLLQELRTFVRSDTEPVLRAPITLAEWLPDALHHTHTEGARSYFEKALHGYETPALFDETDQLSHARSQLSRDLTQQWRATARAAQIRPSTLWSLAWALVQAQVCSQAQACFGVVVSGRTHSGRAARRAMGLLVNTLPVYLSLNDLTIRQAAQDLEKQLIQLGQWERSALPWVQSASAIAPPTPLFNAVFNYRRVAPDNEDLPVLWLEEGDNATVSVTIEEAEDICHLHMTSRTSVAADALCALLEQALVAVIQALTQTDSPAALSLDLLPAASRERVQEQWSGVKAPTPPAVDVVEAINQQAQRMPQALALEHDGKTITYAALLARSTRYARWLSTQQVRGQVLAVAVPRSPEAVVALLAVLQAGAIALPLDPTLPAARRRLLLEDSQAHAVLTTEVWRTAFDAQPVWLVDGDVEHAPDTTDAPLPTLTPQDPAYLIYTSGSTGVPKGVLVEHGALSHLVGAVGSRYALTPQDRVLQFANLSFDVALEEIFSTLCHGATLVLRTDDYLIDAAGFWPRCEHAQLSVLNLPTAFWHALVEGAPVAIPQSIRVIIIGGEAVRRTALQRWHALPGHRPVLLNAYGPTEATITATVETMTEHPAPQVSIGRPLPGVWAYVVDAQGRLLPPGVPGELWLGGQQLAREYWRRSAHVNAEKFLPNPFHAGRVYRTGDRVRWRDDGALEYLGRIDEQIKLRGYRIEPGEIEQAIASQTDVQQAIVMLRDGRLSAFVSPASALHDIAALQQHLRACLPDYMVPTDWIPIDEWPLTPSGKIDKKKLAVYRPHKHRQTAPQTPTEKKLAALWEEVLQYHPVQRDDNFFSLGGHSLLLVSMAERARQMGLKLGLAEVYRSPVLAELAQRLDHAAIYANDPSAQDPPPALLATLPQTWVAPATDMEKQLAEWWELLLEQGPVGREDHFFALGGHSLLLVRLLEIARQAGVAITALDVFETPVLHALAARLESRPPVADDPPIRSALRAEERQRVIAQMAGGEHNVQDILPLWPLQEGMLYHYLLDRDQDPYKLDMVLAFNDHTQQGRFIEAVQQVIKRHDALRTAFFSDGLQAPQQVVLRNAPAPVFVLAETADAAEQHLMQAMRAQPLLLEQAPNVQLWTLADPARGRWLTGLRLHHIASDHLSLETFAEEVKALLLDPQALLSEPVPLRTMLSATQNIATPAALTYFRSQLSDLTHVPAPLGVAEVASSKKNEVQRELSAELTRRMVEQARRHGVNAAALFHLAWGMTVAHLSKTADVVMGTVLLGRSAGQPGAARAFGMFMNTLPLRLRLDQWSVRQALQETHVSLAHLLMFENTPLPRVQQVSGIRAPQPLFYALMNYRHSRQGAYERRWPGAELLSADEAPTHPISLSVDDWQSGYTLVCETVPSIDAEPLVQAMETALEDVLHRLEYDPDTIVLESAPWVTPPAPSPSALPAVAARPLTTPIEQQLAAIWSEVLQTEVASSDAHFFALGGHSLLATQVVSRIREAFKMEVPLRVIFEAPRLDEFAQRLQGLQPTQPFAQFPLLAVPRGQPLPATFSQMRMWTVQCLAPGSSAYNMPTAVRFKGLLNVAALEQALQSMVQRHEAFRTRFAVIDGELMQIIEASCSWAWQQVDWREHEEAALLEALQQDAMLPFDLAQFPLHRATLYRLGEQDYVLMWVMHHAISDQWSDTVLMTELAQAYRAYSAGHAPDWPPLAVQYADYAVWQRQVFGAGLLDTQMTYWRTQLAQLPALTLPVDRVRPSSPRFLGANISQALPAGTLSRVQALAVAHHATPFMVLLAVFRLLLSRLSGQTDFAIGTPIANRTHLAAERLIGTLVNTLVMRTEVQGCASFDELLTRERETALQAYAHQDVPFEMLVEALHTGRDAQTPFIQVLFNVPNAPGELPSLPGLTYEPVEFDAGSAQFDLSLSVDTEEFQEIHLEYSTELFKPETAQRLLNYYLRLLQAVCADSTQALWHYPLLSDAEREQTLYEWNQTKQAIAPQCVTQLFTAQSYRTPDAPAVRQAEQQLSYQTLLRQSNQIAHWLRAQGVSPGMAVGLCLERTLLKLPALLGILKTGAAYVPLDPAFPRERLAMMAEDAGLQWLLTQTNLRETVPGAGIERLCIDHVAQWQAYDDTDHDSATPDALAYIIYTSGSTGKPKGVEITHSALTNFLISMRAQPGCGTDDRCLAVTTLSFDIAGLEFYLPLISGACIELASTAEANDGRLLLERMQACQPTLMQATPATWRMLIEAGWRGTPGLRILCGGEPLARELAAALLTRCAQLWNMYGPTETTIWSTLENITARNDEISIGRPIANTTVYVLDERLQPVPPGVMGELWIGGAGLARGYRQRPELTAERFVADPFVPNGRMYRTGDYARWLTDGRLMHMGRADFQVKIRGFRIELGEIETVLARHPLVIQAVVTARDDARGIKQLVAYVIPATHTERALLPQQLRQFVRASLPEYMCPTQVLLLDQFPLTANRKVDLKALPAPTDTPMKRKVAEPRTTLETQLLALWRQSLDTDDIGIDDDFFEAGGQSLRAVQLLTQIEKVLDRHLPLATLFEAPSVARMAAWLNHHGELPERHLRVTVQANGTRPPLFLVPGVGGNSLVFGRLAKLLGRDQPLYGLQARGLNPGETPFASVAEAADHFVPLIRAAQPQGPYLIGGTCVGGVTAFEIAQRLQRSGETVALIILESWHPTSYARAPQWQRWWGPLIFVARRLRDYARELRARSPRDAWAFLLGKWRRARQVVGHAVHHDYADFNEIRELAVMDAALRAVAQYRTEPYHGSLLNIIAARRTVDDGLVDTRRAWESLVRGEVVSIAIPAEDSGRLFVSPHVESLAQHMRQYVDNTLAANLRS